MMHVHMPLLSVRRRGSPLVGGCVSMAIIDETSTRASGGATEPPFWAVALCHIASMRRAVSSRSGDSGLLRLRG